LKTAFAKMHRWFGNMLRNNGRAIALGPRRMGLFTWWCLVDQRISIWTALAGPVGAILMSVFISPWFFCLYLFVAILVRLIYLMVLSVEGLRLSVQHLPQLFFTQWVGAMVKIHVQFRLNRQSWGADRGGSQDHRPGTASAWMQRWVPVYQTVVSVTVFFGLVAILVGVVRLPSWPPFVLASEAKAMAFILESTGGTGVSLDVREYGLDARDDESDSDALERALAALPASGRGELRLPPGRIVLDRPLVIERDHTWIAGAGSGSTRLVARFDSTAGEAAVLVRGAGRTHRARARTLRTSLPSGRCLAALSDAETFLVPDDVLWLGSPNDEPFLDDLGSTLWRRSQPWLRQTLVDVQALASNHALLRRPLRLSLPRGARVERVELREDVHLLDFALELEIPGARFAETDGRYENLYPNHAVDGVAFHWVRDSSAERLRIERSGRHPVNLDQALRVALLDLEIDGAWNKGPGGMGYVRFARSYESSLERSQVRGIRHVTFQWSAAGNRIEQSHIEVDVNFHGGFSRDNEVVASVVEPRAGHPWPAIVHTPDDAHWAPPDGPGNRATDKPLPTARCSAARSAGDRRATTPTTKQSTAPLRGLDSV